ncbi:extracellular solute-binding protein [Cohnella sp. GCM10020058]|uniref:extracellular solute-binding protein n=1 Tax=Cohnella sp. GCM10020058 TaxID=3317330 RepID=UPI00363319C6
MPKTMPKKKIVLSGAMSVALAGTLLAGCSGGSGNDNADKGASSQPASNSSASSSASASASEKPMDVMFWTTNPEKVNKDSFAVKTVEQQFNVNIELKPRNSETYREKLLLDIASGQIPDWFNDQNFADYDKFVDQGVVAEIPPELLEQYAPKYVEWLKKELGDNPFQYTMRDGKNYSMPIMWSIGPRFHATGIRQDWLEKVGITKVPETLDELEVALDKFSHGDPDGNGKQDTIGLTGVFPSIFEPVFGAYGVYPNIFTEENGKVVRGEIEPAAKDALTVLAKWYKQGLIDPEFVVNKYSNADDKIISEKAGVVTNAWWDFTPADAFSGGDYYEKIVTKNPNVKWGVIGAPTGPNGQKGDQQINPVVSSGLQFGKQLEKDRDKMIKYIQIFEATSFDTPTYEKVTYGEEGVTFNKNNGDIDWIPPYDKEDERAKYGVGFVQFPGSFNDYDFLKPYMTKSKYMDIRNETEAKAVGKYDILEPIEKPIFNEYKDRLTQLTNKAFIDFITGKRPLDQFDQFVAEWKKMGGEKVMAEAQQKYDEVFK